MTLYNILTSYTYLWWQMGLHSGVANVFFSIFGRFQTFRRKVSKLSTRWRSYKIACLLYGTIQMTVVYAKESLFINFYKAGIAALLYNFHSLVCSRTEIMTSLMLMCYIKLNRPYKITRSRLQRRLIYMCAYFENIHTYIQQVCSTNSWCANSYYLGFALFVYCPNFENTRNEVWTV